jgi:hypothetical protein
MIILILLGLVSLWPVAAEAFCPVQTTPKAYAAATDLGDPHCSPGGGVVVEHMYSRGLAAGADTQIKAGAGFLHAISCWGSDVAATAGTIAVLDHTAAGGGTTMISYQIAAALLLPTAMVIDVPFTTGLYLDFTTTNDVTCLVSYR